jgi:hypothetical protein
MLWHDAIERTPSNPLRRQVSEAASVSLLTIAAAAARSAPDSARSRPSGEFEPGPGGAGRLEVALLDAVGRPAGNGEMERRRRLRW